MNKQYHTIRTMADLRIEREKLRWRIRSTEDVLERDYREVCQMFTFANVVRTIFAKIENVQSLIAGIRGGYESITALFRKKHTDGK